MDKNKPHGKNLRIGRYSQAGNYYFLTTCVAGRRSIFTETQRAAIVLSTIRWLQKANRFAVDAAVVMPDHVHLVGQLKAKSLSGVMHSLKSFTAKQLAATRVPTPVWQSGFHDHGLRHDEDYRRKVRYVLENPVRAGLVEQVEDYPHLILPDWWVEQM